MAERMSLELVRFVMIDIAKDADRAAPRAAAVAE